MGVLEVHTWNSRYARIEQPDRIVIDIDPGEAVEWPAVVAAARSVRELLHALDLDSFVKTTGGRGLHIVMPLVPAAGWSDCLDFARAFAETLERRDPAHFTTRFAKLGRENKILIDYLRNNRTNTSIAAFSTRARPGAPVSMPLTWSELSASRTPDRFTLRTVPARLARLRSDPWEGYDAVRHGNPQGGRRRTRSVVNCLREALPHRLLRRCVRARCGRPRPGRGTAAGADPPGVRRMALRRPQRGAGARHPTGDRR